MIVMKFGGSSIADFEGIQRTAEIIKDRLKDDPIVVVSAYRGVTDELIQLAYRAQKGYPDSSNIDERHMRVIKKLGLPDGIITEVLDELAILLQGISMVRELSPRTLDYVLSFGERLSSRTIAAYLNKVGIPAEQYDAYLIGMITDNNFGSASPLPDAFPAIKGHISGLKRVPIITGYIGRTKEGDITTLGRNGSDYSASIIGAAINAKEIQIWTDVGGIMTADPAIVPSACPIEFMSFDEASELAFYGARVLHPSTIIPAIKSGIPVRVLNTFQPGLKGTTILPRGMGITKGVKSIVYKKDQYIVNIVTPRMLLAHGFMARIFEIFNRYRIVLHMVSTSEVSVSVTIDSPQNLQTATRELSEFAEVNVESQKAIVCVVGEGLRDIPGISGIIFHALKEANVNVLMISQASKINIAFVIDNQDVNKTVERLHQIFF
jgi:aspartate kinase